MIGKIISGLFGGFIVALLGFIVVKTSLSLNPESDGPTGAMAFFIFWVVALVIALTAPRAGKAWRRLLIISGLLAFSMPIYSLIFAGATVAEATLGMGGLFFLGVIFLVTGLLIGRDKQVVIIKESKTEHTLLAEQAPMQIGGDDPDKQVVIIKESKTEHTLLAEQAPMQIGGDDPDQFMDSLILRRVSADYRDSILSDSIEELILCGKDKAEIELLGEEKGIPYIEELMLHGEFPRIHDKFMSALKIHQGFVYLVADFIKQSSTTFFGRKKTPEEVLKDLVSSIETQPKGGQLIDMAMGVAGHYFGIEDELRDLIANKLTISECMEILEDMMETGVTEGYLTEEEYKQWSTI